MRINDMYLHTEHEFCSLDSFEVQGDPKKMRPMNMLIKTNFSGYSNQTSHILSQPITRRQILDSSKPNKFADDNFKFDENGKKLSKRVKKHCGKRRNCLLQAISPFPKVFSKGLFPRGVKRCHCVGMG